MRSTLNFEEFFSEQTSKRSFNIVGPCNIDKHYMVNIDEKLKKIIRLIQNDSYFVINRPRQFGKTTTLNQLVNILKSRYEVINIDFQVLGFIDNDEKDFCRKFISMMSKELGYKLEKATNMLELSNVIQTITSEKSVILVIDEVDKISNNTVFLDFLSMLRYLFIQRSVGKSTAFKSVILSGVYDIKNLKLKFKNDLETRYNSPWNIAVDFNINMDFKTSDIACMLGEYVHDTNIKMNINDIAKVIYKFTNGYPYLVSLICKIIDESDKYEWTVHGVNMAIKNILLVTNTLFDDLSKNISNNKELYKFFREILLEDKKVLFNFNIPIINLASMFGYIKPDGNGYVTISNIMFSEVILNHMVERVDTSEIDLLNEKSKYISVDNELSMDKVIEEFQRFMKKSYERGNHKFLEDDGRLLFSAFITPIINGTGYFYREARTGDMRRMDLVVQYGKDRFIIELKRDIGYSTEKTLQQVQDYMLLENTNIGYIITFTYGKRSAFIEHKKQEKVIKEYFI
ncbi:AAA family ATPase [uncultured Clostridium sp.]|uniref:AAA family ATPase n=1 Tax=uncultured Clostridium sp. TaxID=59620 RepID=UPI002638DB24|nr:AAA family ATPase [uncultured Clostridium sp.]